jgi:hypothetical protein
MNSALNLRNKKPFKNIFTHKHNGENDWNKHCGDIQSCGKGERKKSHVLIWYYHYEINTSFWYN